MCTHFPNFLSSSKCVFNLQGTRILGGTIDDPFVVMVTDVSTLTVGAAAAAEQVRFSAQGYSFPIVGKLKLCFVGRDDNSVVFSFINWQHFARLVFAREPKRARFLSTSRYTRLALTHSASLRRLTTSATMSLFLLIKRRSSSCRRPSYSDSQVCLIQLLALIAVRTYSVIQHR